MRVTPLKIPPLAGAVLAWLALAVASVVAPVASHAADAQPRAPYVPTPQIVVDTMLDLAAVKAGDYVIDLGSGDGRIVTTAAKRHGARGLGVELDATLVQFARQYAREQGVGGRVRFERADLFKTDLRAASVVTLYLLPDMLVELRPKLLSNLRPGTRIVAHDFDLGDWRPDEHLSIPVPLKPVGPAPQSDIYLWIVPANIEGEWRGTVAGRPLRLEATQRFQEVELAVELDGLPREARAVRLRGARLGFELESGAPGVPGALAESSTATATVAGDRMTGTFRIGERALGWQAVRVRTSPRSNEEPK